MKKSILIFTISFLAYGCSSSDASQGDDGSNVEANGGWLVNELDVTGQFSLYPLSENPEFTTVSNIQLDDNELVGILSFGTQLRVFPYSYTVQNEIINDTYQGVKYTFSYCPITKSSIGFRRSKVFRASGYLFKNNLTPWDEETETIWSQMLVKGIKGEKINQRLNTLPILETRWKTVKDHFSNAMVLFGTPPLNEKNSTSKNDSHSNNSSTLLTDEPHNSELVYGMLDDFDNVYVFKYSDFSSRRLDIIIRGEKYIVVGNSSKRTINAFKVQNFDDYETLGQEEFPFVLKDRSGVKYNIFGVSRNGIILQKPKYAYVAAWWAWDDIFDNFIFVE